MTLSALIPLSETCQKLVFRFGGDEVTATLAMDQTSRERLEVTFLAEGRSPLEMVDQVITCMAHAFTKGEFRALSDIRKVRIVGRCCDPQAPAVLEAVQDLSNLYPFAEILSERLDGCGEASV